MIVNLIYVFLKATAPSRVLFLFSCHLVIVMGVLRFMCVPEFEDIVALCIMYV